MKKFQFNISADLMEHKEYGQPVGKIRMDWIEDLPDLRRQAPGGARKTRPNQTGLYKILFYPNVK